MHFLMKMGQDMTHFIFLCFQVKFVELLRYHFNGNPFRNFYTEAFKTVNLFGIVREQAEFPGTQVLEDLRANPVFTQIRGEAELFVRFYRVVAPILERIGLELVDQADTAPFLTHVEKDTAPFLVDL